MWEEAGMKLNSGKKRVIVITGGIGTGKSTVVNIIKDLGFIVLDSDKLVHEGYNIGNDLYYKVIKRFGEEILNEDNTINRQRLGKIVFNNNEDLKDLNSIVHEYVRCKLIEGVDSSNDEVIFLDIPLILESLKDESQYKLQYDEIWLVYVNEEIQINRLTNRAIKENKNPQDVLNIISKQIPISEKVSMVHEVINNEGTIQELEAKVKELLKTKDIGW